MTHKWWNLQNNYMEKIFFGNILVTKVQNKNSSEKNIDITIMHLFLKFGPKSDHLHWKRSETEHKFSFKIVEKGICEEE